MCLAIPGLDSLSKLPQHCQYRASPHSVTKSGAHWGCACAWACALRKACIGPEACGTAPAAAAKLLRWLVGDESLPKSIARTPGSSGCRCCRSKSARYRLQSRGDRQQPCAIPDAVNAARRHPSQSTPAALQADNGADIGTAQRPLRIHAGDDDEEARDCSVREACRRMLSIRLVLTAGLLGMIELDLVGT